MQDDHLIPIITILTILLFFLITSFALIAGFVLIIGFEFLNLIQQHRFLNGTLTEIAIMSTRPQLERLEERCTPATVRAVAGNLLVSAPVGPLSVEVIAPGTVRVTDNATNAVFNGISNLISIQGTNLADSISLRANVVAFPGTVVISTLNGNDTVDLGGNFRGNVTLVTGLGNDSVVATNNHVRIGGVFTMADVGGNNTWNMNCRDWIVGQDLTVFGFSSIGMGLNNTLRVGRFATITALQRGSTFLTLALNGQSVEIGGTFSITGGTTANFVGISSKLSVGGNFFLSQRGTSNNTFNLTPAAGGTGVNGTLFYTGGTGADSVVFGINAAIAGDTILDLGNGTNGFVDGGSTSYSGDLRLFGGNDTTTLSINGVIDGNLNLFVGNGTNTVTVTKVPAGSLRFRGGNGTDILRLRGVGTYNVDASFGTGANTFDIDRVGLVLNGTVAGSGGNNTFIQGEGILLPTVILINFPV